MTPRQERFIAEYVKDLNATQAYMRAGYSPGGAAQAAEKLLRNADICAAIAKRQQAIGQKLEITAEKVLSDLESHRKAAAMDGQHSAAIRAAELLGKHIGMFVDRSETVVTERTVIRAPEPAQTAEEWRASLPKPH
jgi:phage terminase small subunit